jgi:hypothetical protein
MKLEIFKTNLLIVKCNFIRTGKIIRILTVGNSKNEIPCYNYYDFNELNIFQR